LASSLLIATAALAGCGALVDGRADRREAAAEAAFPPIGQFVHVDGQRVHYVVQGRGPDLVLIHGASGNLRDFTFQFIDRVKGDYRVWAFDRPGMGYSDRATPGFVGPALTTAESPAQQAAMLHAAATQLGVTRPIVLGHSFGGAVALAWALNHDPGALVTVSAVSNPWPGGLGPFYTVPGSAFGGAALVPLITAFVPESAVKNAIDSTFRPQQPPAGYNDYIGAPLTLRRASFRANARQVNTVRPHILEMVQRYPNLTLPVEIVHGTADQTVPLRVHSEPLSLQIPGANLVTLDGVGHMPHHVAPGAVIAAIDRAAQRAGLR